MLSKYKLPFTRTKRERKLEQLEKMAKKIKKLKSLRGHYVPNPAKDRDLEIGLKHTAIKGGTRALYIFKGLITLI